MYTPDAVESLRCELIDYQTRWPEEAWASAQFLALLDASIDPFRRERLAGHFTASAWLVSADGRRVLLTHHLKLKRWLQLGGHADGERDLAAAALREAEEESGLHGLTIDPAIFDLDRHWIPERGHEPGHWHYDVRYVVHAGADEAFVVSAESLDLAWREIAALAEDADIDISLRRMAWKFLHAFAAYNTQHAPIQAHARSTHGPHPI